MPFQDATFVPVTFNAGTYRNGNITLPRVDAITAKDKGSKLWLEITNLDANQPVKIEVSLAGVTPELATGQTLTASKIDCVNTFESPNMVVPKPISAKVQGNKLSLKLEPKSMTVLSVEQ